ncbi:hypothetical protein T492DRAFT_935309 [Pavlovales sp. CCMP2436]|nr:hypothetical protein T492DRAFT_935309 [Pavlovales sp. CCMP2436]
MALRACGTSRRRHWWRDGDARLTDLPPDILEHVLADLLVQPSYIASAQRTCRAFASLKPWFSAFSARWGWGGVAPRASVGKMAYLLRECCEEVQNRPRADVTQFEWPPKHIHLQHRWFTIDLAMDEEFPKTPSYFSMHSPALARDRARRRVDSNLDHDDSARAVKDLIHRGLYFLADHENTGSPSDEGVQTGYQWRAMRFVLASKRGDLVLFRATDVEAGLGHVKEGRMWRLHATVVGVADEPHMAEAMRGSHGLRDKELHDWFEGLFDGGDPLFIQGPSTWAPSPLPGCGEPICLVDCKVEFGTKKDPHFSQSIKPPPSPAVVSSLLDSLGLDKGVVHADDLLFALLSICDMVPNRNYAPVNDSWRKPPKGLLIFNGLIFGKLSPHSIGNNRYNPGLLLWTPCRGLVYDQDYKCDFLEFDGPPVRMTWASGLPNPRADVTPSESASS